MKLPKVSWQKWCRQIFQRSFQYWNLLPWRLCCGNVCLLDVIREAVEFHSDWNWRGLGCGVWLSKISPVLLFSLALLVLQAFAAQSTSSISQSTHYIASSEWFCPRSLVTCCLLSYLLSVGPSVSFCGFELRKKGKYNPNFACVLIDFASCSGIKQPCFSSTQRPLKQGPV